jgi:type I restriction enzyme R subunit/putative DNA methylase
MNATTEKQQNEHNPILKVRHGAYLPHITLDRAVYSVTFRLADSLPESVLHKWKAEREDMPRLASRLNRPLSAAEEKRLREVFSLEVEEHLNRGFGACWMNRDAVASAVAETLHFFDHQRYCLLAWCVMPNHVHSVIQPQDGHELPDIVHSWKSFSAKRANQVIGRKGRFWHTEYYDHVIRNETDLAHAVEYALGNPEKAGLMKWKWTGCADV